MLHHERLHASRESSRLLQFGHGKLAIDALGIEFDVVAGFDRAKHFRI